MIIPLRLRLSVVTAFFLFTSTAALVAISAASTADAVVLQPGDFILATLTPEIFAVDSLTGTPTVVASGPPLIRTVGVAIDASGDIFVTSFRFVGTTVPSNIVRIDPVTGKQTLIADSDDVDGFLQSPAGFVIDANGDLLVGDPGGSRAEIIRVDPATGAQTVVVAGGLYEQRGCGGLAIEASGSLLCHQEFDPDIPIPGRVLRVDPVTGMQTVAYQGGFFDDGQALGGIGVEADGDIIMIIASVGLIRVDFATGAQTLINSALGASSFGDIEAAANGDIIFAGSSGLSRVDPVSGDVTVISSFQSQFGLAIVPGSLAAVPTLFSWAPLLLAALLVGAALVLVTRLRTRSG